MRGKIGLIIAGAILLAGLTGCRGLGPYLEARGRDLAEVVNLDFGYGYGLAAEARLGDLAHAGLGAGRTWRWGLRYGRTGSWEETVYGLALVHWHTKRPRGTWDETTVSAIREEEHTCLVSPWLSRVALGPDYSVGVYNRSLDLEVSLVAGVLGARLGLAPLELVDFLAGLAGFDPLWDDDLP